MATGAARARGLTAEDLFFLPNEEDLRRELDEGELIEMAPVSFAQGSSASALDRFLGDWAEAHSEAGEVGVEIGFVLRRSPDVVRGPDVAFVRAERLKGRDLHRFFEGAPDLAVEILSPSQTAAQMLRKVRQYLKYGTHTVWVVVPAARQVQVYRQNGKDQVLSAARRHKLTAPDLLPGFSLPLTTLFRRPR